MLISKRKLPSQRGARLLSLEICQNLFGKTLTCKGSCQWIEFRKMQVPRRGDVP
jgi:hypothetical protein